MNKLDQSYLDHALNQAVGVLLCGLADDTVTRWIGLALFVVGTVGRYVRARELNANSEARTDV